jgi:hypothetical protein
MQIHKQLPQNNSKELREHLVIQNVVERILPANNQVFIAL